MNATPVPILLVDDRRENLVALAALLDEIDGLELIQATSGGEALRLLLTRDFGLVLMDVQMPEMDGFEAAALVRANPKTRHVPIIFVTAAADAADFEFRGYESGAVDYLIKPIEPVILHAKVRVFVNLYRQQQAMNEHKRYLAHVEEQVAKRTGGRAARDEQLRVLLVDDRPENLLALEALLADFDDMTVVKANSGAEAMRAIVRDDFAVVLLDVQMPGLDGYEIAEQIHSNQRTRYVPIIFVTAGVEERDTAARGYQHGAVDYLIKPLEPAIVKSKVRVFCDLYRHRLAIEKHNAYLEILAADRTTALQRSTAELVDSRERYRRLAEKLELAARAAGIGIWDWNVLTNELVWDTRMYELYGVPPERFGGAYETWLNTVHPEDRLRCDSAVRAALANQHAYDIEFRIRLPDGTVRDIKGDGKVIFDAQGKAVRMTGVNYDITARKRAEHEVMHHRDGLLELVDERTATLNAVVDHAPDGIITVDQAGRILGFNAAAERMFGYTAEEIVGRNDSVLVPQPHRFVPEGYLQESHEGKDAHALETGRELLGQRQDGSVFPLYLAVSTMEVRGQRRYTGIARDISPQKALEARLIQAREAAEIANRSKSDFLANMSHEIRTPMNAVIGMTHLALQTDLSTKQRGYLENVERAAQGLLGVINDILDFSKIEAGKLMFEHTEFQLNGVLDHVSSLFQIKAREKGLELLFDIHSNIPQALIGDPLRLQQVLMNLVGNAVKFTERGEVVISVSRLERTKNSVVLRFEVRDTGIGISPAQSGKLFSAFVQGDSSTTRTYGGSGLGLSISKKLVEMMGGQLALKSELGVGSRFIFTVQFGLQDEQPHTKPVNADLRGLRVLVVDDNTVARNIMVSIVESLQFQVGISGNGLDALTELNTAARAGQPYQAILVDWSMPSMDGLELVRRIRAGAVSPPPAVVMVTAHSREKLMEGAQGIKLDGLLEKPVTASAVLETVARALSKESQNDEPPRPRRSLTYEEAREQVSGAYVLLVEDNQINQDLALDILTSAGIKVDLAANGVEALERVARETYDAVLMDCQMPIMDGFEATRQIRLDPRNDYLPILAMTANAMVGDREKCLVAGMNAHIPKPIDVNHLFRVLAKWIKPRGLRRTGSRIGNSPKYPAPQKPMPQLPGIDMEAVMKRLMGNSEQYRRLLTMFYQGQSNAVERIRNAWDSGNKQEARRETHTLAGLAATIGAGDVAGAATALEAALAGEGVPPLPALLEKVEEPLDSLIEALERFLATD